MGTFSSKNVVKLGIYDFHFTIFYVSYFGKYFGDISEMKKKLFSFLLVFTIMVFGTTTDANAKAAFFSWGGETIEKVVDFPDTPNFQINNDYIDAGYRYKEITIFFLPLWTYDYAWCGYIPNNPTSYYPLTKKQVVSYAQMASITLPDTPELGFWTKWGGKLVLGLIIVIFFIYGLSKHEPQTFEEVETEEIEDSGIMETPDAQEKNGSVSEQEAELQRIEEMYKNSDISDEERKAMRAKVLGI